mmetsp:Transcript_34552/g.64519  ORF Transcript_34552/g.64519 Transcript_34552/m.64519 type:complete len:531 (+) Transcript_34552:142-1734(+)
MAPAALELVVERRRLRLPGGVVQDVPLHGPPLNVADVAPDAGRLFVATAHAVVGFSLLDIEAVDAGPNTLLVPEVQVPLPGAVIRLHCGALGCRPVVAVVHQGGVTLFLADLPCETAPAMVRLRSEDFAGTPTGGVAIVPDDENAGYLYIGTAEGHVCCWRFVVSEDGSGLHRQGAPTNLFHLERRALSTATPTYGEEGVPSNSEAGAFATALMVARWFETNDVAVVDLDVRGTSAVAAGLDGRLNLWKRSRDLIDATDLLPDNTSMPKARVDCAEVPTLWGVRYMPLGSVLQSVLGTPQGSLTVAAAVAEAPAPLLPEWATLPGELVCRSVFPFASLRDLACAVALLSRAHRAGVESELKRVGRNDLLTLCFSDCTAWLLDSRLRVLARQDLPFCAAHSHAVMLPEFGMVLVAPKTDLVATPGPSIAAMPHAWALTCHRRPGKWKLQLQVRRFDLRPLDTAVIAAAVVTGRGSEDGDRRQAPPAAPPTSAGEMPGRDAEHVLGLAAKGDRIWTLLATGELLVHRIVQPA